MLLASAGALVGVVGASLAAAGAPAAVRSSPPASSSAASTPAEASAGTPGCGRAPSPTSQQSATSTGDLGQTLVVDGGVRTYRLAVPASYRRDAPTPLLLVFHGSGSNALQTSIYTQLARRGAAAGFLVATPDGRGGQWQISLPNAHTPDLDFVQVLLADLAGRFCVDRARVFAAGISQGAEFSAIAACAVPGRIAAIGLVTAEFLLGPCRGPVSVLAFHGTADPLVPYGGGGSGRALPGLDVPSVQENLASWAHLDRCHPAPRLAHPASAVVRESWGGCAGGSAVVLDTLEGGGHTWPGAPIILPAAAFGPTNEQVDATGLMLAFFAQHPFAG